MCVGCCEVMRGYHTVPQKQRVSIRICILVWQLIHHDSTRSPTSQFQIHFPETANLNPKLDVQDLWLVHDDTMDRLRADPRFVAASQRVAEATCGL